MLQPLQAGEEAEQAAGFSRGADSVREVGAFRDVGSFRNVVIKSITRICYPIYLQSVISKPLISMKR